MKRWVSGTTLSILFAAIFVASVALAIPGMATAQATSSSTSASAPDLKLPAPLSSNPALAASEPGRGNVPGYILAGKIGEIPGNAFSYTPSEIWQAYQAGGLIRAGITGQGETIAIVDAWGDPNIQSELAMFDAEFNLPAPPSFHVLCIDGPCNYTLGITYGWNVEIALDVEWSHAMAPGAAINLYIGSDSGDALYDADLAAVEGASGTGPGGSGLGTPGVYHTNIISNSWGEPENDLLSSQSYTTFEGFGYSYPWLNQVFQVAAAKGITVFACAGDTAAYDQGDGYYQTLPAGGVQFPASSPYVTAVGGTSLYMNTRAGSLSFPPGNARGSYGEESAWSWIALTTGYLGGGVGGFSTLYPQPAYQTGLGVPNTGVRGVPDVAWDADPYTGVVIALAGQFSLIGGTSVGSPSWAGVMALVDQAAGRSVGFMNPTFYSILNQPDQYAEVFHDVTTGNNDGYNAGPGWDPVTGLGSPNVQHLVQYVVSHPPSVSVTVTNNLNPGVAASTPTLAYRYGATVTLRASVNDHSAVSGPVTARILAQNGDVVAASIPMMWDSMSKTYVGTYTVKTTDPPGDWLAEVVAVSGSHEGWGYNAFQVGDSILVGAPLPGPDVGVIGYNFYLVGDTIPLAIYVQNAEGTAPIGGGGGAHYTATFRFDGPSGKVEGSVALTYNHVSGLWEGTFTIPKNVDQGAWAVVFSGVDRNGNWAAAAYSWVNVGLFILPFTSNPYVFPSIGTSPFANSYVLGETITIYGYTGAATGSFTGTVSFGSTVLGAVHLALINAADGLWGGTYHISSSGPTGFYTVTVSGGDGHGNRGSFSSVVRVAPYVMTLHLSLSSKVIPLTGGHELISVKVTNGNGKPVTVGTIMAYIYIQFKNGTIFNALSSFTTQQGLPLTYDPGTGSFVGVFTSVGPPGTVHGKYTVQIQAWDPVGNYGTALGAFTVAT